MTIAAGRADPAERAEVGAFGPAADPKSAVDRDPVLKSCEAAGLRTRSGPEKLRLGEESA